MTFAIATGETREREREKEERDRERYREMAAHSDRGNGFGTCVL